MRSRLSGFRADGGFERWEGWTEWPLVGLALVFLVVLILPLAHPVSAGVSRGLDMANILIWALFAADYLILLYLALDRRRFVRTHVLDLLVVVLPFLRPFRLLRLFAIIASTTRRAGGRLVQRVTVFAVLTAVVVMAASAAIVYSVEHDTPGGNIKTLGDSMWWGMTTVATVGYGDRFPVRAEGRLVASVLMLTGIALLGRLPARLRAGCLLIVLAAAAATWHWKGLALALLATPGPIASALVLRARRQQTRAGATDRPSTPQDWTDGSLRRWRDPSHPRSARHGTRDIPDEPPRRAARRGATRGHPCGTSKDGDLLCGRRHPARPGIHIEDENPESMIRGTIHARPAAAELVEPDTAGVLRSGSLLVAAAVNVSFSLLHD